MLKAINAALMSLLCVACISASPAKVDAHFAPLKAATMQDLINRWGAPPAQSTVNGVNYAEWTRTDVSNKPSISIGIGGFGSRVGGGVSTTTGGGQQLDACTVTVAYDEQGNVTDLRWRGETDVCIEQFSSPIEK